MKNLIEKTWIIPPVLFGLFLVFVLAKIVFSWNFLVAISPLLLLVLFGTIWWLVLGEHYGWDDMPKRWVKLRDTKIGAVILFLCSLIVLGMILFFTLPD